jgi:hypothetical protein
MNENDVIGALRNLSATNSPDRNHMSSCDVLFLQFDVTVGKDIYRSRDFTLEQHLTKREQELSTREI